MELTTDHIYCQVTTGSSVTGKGMFTFLLACMFLVGSGIYTRCCAQSEFNNLDTLLAYAMQRSYIIKTGEQQRIQARHDKWTAIANIPDLKSNVDFSVTDNNKLPVNFLPAEILGGPPGTYKEVTLGQRYVNNLTGYAALSLFNLPAWDQLKNARINTRLTASNNQLNRRTLSENIATAYFNIINLQEQLVITRQSLAAADTLWQVTKEKYAQGIIRRQDMNDAEANYLNVQGQLSQLSFQLSGQYNDLKLLCDIPLSDTVKIKQPIHDTGLQPVNTTGGSNLYYDNMLLKEHLAKTEWAQYRHVLLPTLTAYISDSRLQNSNSFALFDNDVKWVHAQYYGIKLSWTLPSASTFKQLYTARSNYNITKLNTEHAKLETEADNTQRLLEYQKAFSQLNTSARIYQLKADNYRKSFNQFSEGLLAVDKTITAFNDMLSSHYEYRNALVTVLSAKARIDINNRIK